MRYYENKFPEIDEYVVVKVQNIEEMGAYVSLLEYDNIEGMIQFTELSRRRIRSVSKLIRVGKTEICVVLRVDKEKGNIDLSKRRVNPEDVGPCELKYNKAKSVHNIMRHIAEVTNQDLEQLYKDIAWPLYKEFGHAHDAFRLALKEPERVFKNCKFTKEETKKQLMQLLEHRMRAQPIKLRADIEVTCFASEGIDAIKEALKDGERAMAQLQQKDSSDSPIRIQLIAPPLYVMITTTGDQQAGIAIMDKGIEAIKQKILLKQGSIVIRNSPRMVSAKDDHSLNQLMESLRDKDEELQEPDEEDEEVIGM